MSKKVQMEIRSTSFGVKVKEDDDIPTVSFSASGEGWTLRWKGNASEAPFEVNKEDIGNEVMVEITFKNQKTLEEFNEPK